MNMLMRFYFRFGLEQLLLKILVLSFEMKDIIIQSFEFLEW